MKNILKFGFALSAILVFGTNTLAQNGAPIITYTLNETSDNITINPLTNPVQLDFVSDENIENWVSIRIENNEDPSIYKIFLPKSQCDGTFSCGESWNGEISPSDKTLIDGIYSVIVKIKNTIEPAFDLTLTSPYTIQVDTSPEPEPTSTFIIRNGDLELYNGSVTLPEAENDRNVLAVLRTIDESSEAFAISNIQEFSFGLYLKCILPQGGTELCDNWQYAVDNFTPFTSIDTTPLVGGETVGIYFGTSHQLILDTNTITAGGSVNVTAQKYDYENNVWNPLTGISVGVTLPNPEDQWNPIVVATYPVDDLGVANISISDADTYTLGIAEDFYFPSYTVSVSAPNEGGNGGGGGGGGGNETPEPTFSATNALAYLKSVQGSDGSFGDSDLYTDWAGIAFGAMDVSDNSKTSLLDYFSSNNTLSSLLTDNERHAIALLALGQNPYSFDGVNYINAITSDFDGAQFGDVDLVNDDIFALIPLKNSGYTENDDIIIKDIAFLVSKQKNDGSWEESVDITAAAIQALKSFESITGASEAINKASVYLQNSQNDDGGWSNISSTSWAMQAMSALGASWNKNSKTGMDYLATQQTNANNNGAVLPNSDTLQNVIWATSYAIPAGLEKSWDEIMQSVSKPATENNSSNSSSENSIGVSNTEIPANPVVCPLGDLFSATTGQACTAFFQIEPVSIVTNNTPVTNERKTKTTTTTTDEETPALAETIPTITPDTLAASAGLPVETDPNNTVPIALGALSGAALLYLAFKFFVK